MKLLLFLSIPLAVLGLAGLLTHPAQAANERVIITAGAKGGSYYLIGSRLTTELVVVKSHYAETLESRGSIENLERLDDPEHPANVGLTQADALHSYLAKHPEFAQEFLVLADVGLECAFLISNPKSGITSLAELITKGGQVSVGDAGSGGAVTWAHLMQLQPGLRNTEPVSVDTGEALLQIKVGGEFTTIRAAFLVQRPKRRSRSIDLVLNEPDTYSLVPIREGAFGSLALPDGSPVYGFERVAVGGREDRQAETICTRGLLLGAKSKLGKDSRRILSEVMLDAADRIVRDYE